MFTCPPAVQALQPGRSRRVLAPVASNPGVLSLCVLGLYVALSTGAAQAEVGALSSVGVADLRVARTGAIDSSTVFPAGVEAIDVLFEYVDAEGEEIELVVKGRGGIECFRHVAIYDGSGRARVTLRGASMYPVIAETLAGAALEAKRNAKSASTSSFGLKEFLLSAQAGVLRTRYAAETLMAADLADHLESRLEDVLRVVDASSAELAVAIALPTGDISGMQSIAAAVDVALGEAVLAARDLQAAAPSVTRMALPSTGDDSLLLQALVSGSVAATTEFRVEIGRASELIYLPRVEAE